MKIQDFNYGKKAVILFACCFGMIACSDDDSPSGDEVFEINNLSANKVESIDSPLKAGENATYLWSVTSAGSDIYSLTDTHSKSVQLIALPGKYTLELKVTEGNETQQCKVNVTVKNPSTAYSPYLDKVYDFLPSVGQFTNDLPTYKADDTKESMIRKVEENIAGDPKKTSMISLGGFGGYVTFGFDHTIINVTGKRDFRVLGNAFYADANPNPETNKKGGSCEPGIIMVAHDKNGNGKPDDDEWYEIAGSEYNNSKTIHNYEITYYKPDPNMEPDQETGSYVSIKDYIYWEDNQGNTGYKEKNIYHEQSYYPEWINEDKITFKGTLLPPNGVDESGTGSYWVLYALDYGYADNRPNTEDNSAIDIDWAVDRNGNKVKLPGIDFVKVYTGTNQECGWVGETSTEVAGAEDLHLLNISIASN